MKKTGSLLAAALLLLTLTVWTAAQETVPITRANWGAQVGFAPDATPANFTPGMMIDKSSFEKMKPLLPDTVQAMMQRYDLKLEIAAYRPYAPSNGYIAATNAHRGKAKLIDIGGDTEKREIEGYEGGLPFPQPKNGREIAWNYTLTYGGDDGENVFGVYWISAKRGVERMEQWKTTNIRARFRTDIPPMPDVADLVSKGVIFATLTRALKPLDKRGFASLYYGYYEPREPDGWLYIPTQRRAMRLTFGTRGETWNNTDLLYEDVRGYTGSPEWMEWTLLSKQTLLAPAHGQIPLGEKRFADVFDVKNEPHWNPKIKWEPRPMYVVEAKPRLTGYPYSRMVFYIDAESYHIYAKTAYDRKGNLWKLLLNATNDSADPTKLPLRVGLSLVVDTQSNHATAFHWHMQKNNTGVDARLFNLSTLRKLGR